jgi:hypothetical protein
LWLTYTVPAVPPRCVGARGGLLPAGAPLSPA